MGSFDELIFCIIVDDINTWIAPIEAFAGIDEKSVRDFDRMRQGRSRAASASGWAKSLELASKSLSVRNLPAPHFRSRDSIARSATAHHDALLRPGSRCRINAHPYENVKEQAPLSTLSSSFAITLKNVLVRNLPSSNSAL